LLQKYKYFYDQEKFLEISYFLKEICVPELMKYSAYIDSTSIAEEERILICRILKKFDPSNAKEYDLEINERTKKIVIKNGVGKNIALKLSRKTSFSRNWTESTRLFKKIAISL
jgi:hypothetical protein